MSEPKRLYNLLPGIYRQGALEDGEPLGALLAILERELDVLEHDVEATYDNWFVQTCDVWALPYLADLVGMTGLGRQQHILSTQRRQVANAVAYGRRKGSLGALEHILRDVTGWHICAVELARQVAIGPRVTGPRQASSPTVDVRDRAALARVGGAFSQQGHSADVHTLAAVAPDAQQDGHRRSGRYNLGRIGLFTWRLRSYTMRRCPIRPIAPDGPVPINVAPEGFQLYAVDPSGRALPLFNQPEVLDEYAERLEARHIPLPITRLELAADLEAYRARAGDRPEDRPQASTYYGPGRGLLVAMPRAAGGTPTPVPPDEVASVDLADIAPGALAALRRLGVRVAIDAERGWLAVLQPGISGEAVMVDYAYGFSAEIGGGPYHRRSPQDVADDTTLIVVARGTACASLREAVARWEDLVRDRQPQQALKAVIRILDNGLYEGGGGKLIVTLPSDAELTIVADNGVRPTIGGGCRLVVKCDATSARSTAAQRWVEDRPDSRLLHLEGLRIDGGLRVEWTTGPMGATSRLGVQIKHCTIAPNGVELKLAPPQARGTLVEIAHSIVGQLRGPDALVGIIVSDSIIDGAPNTAELAAKGRAVDSTGDTHGPPLDLQRVTVLGGLHIRYLKARDSLITGSISMPVRTEDRALEHCYSCPEDNGAQGARPRFTATRLGEPGYGQLHPACPQAIGRGASDGGELGAFSSLHHPQALDNLATALDEYLPLGLEAGIFYMS